MIKITAAEYPCGIIYDYKLDTSYDGTTKLRSKSKCYAVFDKSSDGTISRGANEGEVS